MHRSTIIASIALAACGGPSPDFNGTFKGDTTICVTSASDCSTQRDTQLRLAVEDDVVRVSGFCPNGTGEMLVRGDGSRLSWAGDVQCSWPPGPACSTSIIRYTSATAEVEGNRLHLSAVGTIIGCGYVVPVDTTFAGVR